MSISSFSSDDTCHPARAILHPLHVPHPPLSRHPRPQSASGAVLACAQLSHANMAALFESPNYIQGIQKTTRPLFHFVSLHILHLFQAVLDDPRPELTGIGNDASGSHSLLHGWSRALMRCNQKGADAKDAGREQDEVSDMVFICFCTRPPTHAPQVYKYTVAKQLQDQGRSPMEVTCVVTNFSPATIRVHACGPLFSSLDLLRAHPPRPSRFCVHAHFF